MAATAIPQRGSAATIEAMGCRSHASERKCPPRYRDPRLQLRSTQRRIRSSLVLLRFNPTHDMRLDVLRMHMCFTQGPATHRYPRGVDGVAITGDEIVPRRQLASFG